MTNLHLVLLCGISLALPLPAARERTLTFENDMEVYTLTFDDSKISENLLRELAWLSPYMLAEIPSPYNSATSETNEGVEKRFLAIPLEMCIDSDSAYHNCEHEQPGTQTFFRNAQVNIEKSQAQLQRIATLKVPRELIPAEQFLRQDLERAISVEKARLAYYKSWNTKYLIDATKAICGDNADLGIVSRLNGQGHGARYRIVRYDWGTQMNACILKQGRYPMQSWKVFLSDYGIREKRRFKRID